MISIIIPVFNEEKVIASLLPMLDALEGTKELLFVDGDSTDETLNLLRNRQIIHSEKGRGVQLNKGALHARGETLFFLHADSLVESDVLLKIEEAVRHGAVYGCLKIRFTKRSLLMKITPSLVTLEQVLDGLPLETRASLSTGTSSLD